ncbi:endonuclease domain-containing protein [Sphingomonas cavernae]|uniref:Endonuclease domain-containing protein n=1 Tax=Sphingomonas cavernae TaxID=2320861 RepID=A0A418WL69_9SPHN|nr:endonuclease domain-containing protein [Sphingomonas cavernae]RJF90777.1 endonuclease domain-containing protein [Sphingomonas cavernae]
MTQKRLTPAARNLRRSATEAEARLWHHLRNRQLEGFKFRRQYPIGAHIADFACEQARLVIELDGGHHADQIDADTLRTRSLEAAGYHVLRFWNTDVLNNTSGVLEAIREELFTATS